MASLVHFLYLLGMALAAAQAPTMAPTSAPTSAPTAAPEEPSSTPTKYVPKTKITFKIALETTATCSDVTEGSAMYVALQTAGSTLAGNVSTDAVAVKCSAGRRLLTGGLGRRLAALNIDFEVTVPTTEATAAQTALAAVDLATATSVFTKAAADAGGSFTITVTQASVDSMKASVVTEVIPDPNSNATSTTSTNPSGGESSSAAFFKPSAVLLAAAIALLAH
eukprot:TRINITY_DN9397_c0_g1_i2.p2 TRINITY_DN9397_c0_g1~~TRINITY_DN9397_c0_g1_i2.p2  ORF type:complete len:223 (-),score=65.83 TRINITY_DN9397_c0_g1_i2:470-1138(-)